MESGSWMAVRLRKAATRENKSELYKIRQEHTA